MSSASLLLTESADAFINFKAAQVLRLRLFPDVGYGDLRQSMLLEIWRKADRYDPERGPAEAFVRTVVVTWVRSELRRRDRLKRHDDRHVCSLESPAAGVDGEQATLGSFLSQADLLRRTGQSPLTDIALLELREAVGHALAELPPSDRDLAEIAIRHGKEAAAREWSLRLDRPVTPRWVRERLQAMACRFRKCGLGAN